MNFCGSTYTVIKGATVVGHGLSDDYQCAVYLDFAYDGVVNYTSSGEMGNPNYIGGKRAEISIQAGSPQAPKECSSWYCTHCRNYIEEIYDIGTTSTIYYNSQSKQWTFGGPPSTIFWAAISFFALAGLALISCFGATFKLALIPPDSSVELVSSRQASNVTIYLPVFTATDPPTPSDIIWSAGIAKFPSSDYIFSDRKARHYVDARKPRGSKPYFSYSPFTGNFPARFLI